MLTAPNLGKPNEGPSRFIDHAEDLISAVLYMADTAENSVNAHLLLPEITAQTLEKAYKEDGNDEIRAGSFKEFVRNYLQNEGRKDLETVYNDITRHDTPVHVSAYLFKIYEKLKTEFEAKSAAKTITGKKVETTAAKTRAGAGAATGLELDAATRKQLGHAQVDPEQDIGERGKNPWPYRK